MRSTLSLALATALLLAGCGGGVSLGFSGGFDDDFDPPSVSIASNVSTVQAGQPVQLIAAASDQWSGIESVAFYRLDSTNNAVLLGTDGSEPYEWTATAPTDGRTTMVVFARARDNAGNRADSALVTITVTP